MYQNHLVRSIKWSSDQLHFDSCACSLHAFCMHTCQDWVSQNWIDFDEEWFAHTSSECLAIINWHLHAHFYHEVLNVCQLSRFSALHAVSKSKWYVDYQTPYPMQGFLWKGGSITNNPVRGRNDIIVWEVLWTHPIVKLKHKCNVLKVSASAHWS